MSIIGDYHRQILAMMGERVTDSDYLRDLSDRLRRVPASFGTDGYDCDRLWHIAARLDEPVPAVTTRDPRDLK